CTFQQTSATSGVGLLARLPCDLVGAAFPVWNWFGKWMCRVASGVRANPTCCEPFVPAVFDFALIDWLHLNRRRFRSCFVTPYLDLESRETLEHLQVAPAVWVDVEYGHELRRPQSEIPF